MALCVVVHKAACLSRPQTLRSSRTSVVARAQPAADLNKKVQDAVKQAEETCAKPGAKQDCAVAWDEVEELSAAVAHKKVAAKVDLTDDPLEQFCKEDPAADECRVYED